MTHNSSDGVSCPCCQSQENVSFSVGQYVTVTVSDIVVLTVAEYEALESYKPDVEYICTEPRGSFGDIVEKIYQGTDLVYDRSRDDFALLPRRPSSLPVLPYVEPEESGEESAPVMIDTEITVDVAMSGRLQIPVSISNKTVMTKEQYLALEDPTHDTEYFIIETLSNSKKVVREIYQGKERIYDLTAADTAFYQSDYLVLAPSDADEIVLSDGRILGVLEY